MAAPKTPKDISEKHALNLDKKSVDKFRMAEEVIRSPVPHI